MILIGLGKESSYARAPSLSVDFKVILTQNMSKRYISEYVYRDWETDRKSTRLNSSHSAKSRMPSSA